MALNSNADIITKTAEYVSEESIGTSFSSYRAYATSNAECANLEISSINNEREGNDKENKELANTLEKDSPLYFSDYLDNIDSIIPSLSDTSESYRNDKLKKKSGINSKSSDQNDIVKSTFTPHGDIPCGPVIPTVVAQTFASSQFQKARHLFIVGMIVDPQHGPLYHAYGNMELVSDTSFWSLHFKGLINSV